MDLRVWNDIVVCSEMPRERFQTSSQAAGGLGDARPVTRVDDSDGLGARDRGHSTARADKDEQAGTDLVAQSDRRSGSARRTRSTESAAGIGRPGCRGIRTSWPLPTWAVVV